MVGAGGLETGLVAAEEARSALAPRHVAAHAFGLALFDCTLARYACIVEIARATRQTDESVMGSAQGTPAARIVTLGRLEFSTSLPAAGFAFVVVDFGRDFDAQFARNSIN